VDLQDVAAVGTVIRQQYSTEQLAPQEVARQAAQDYRRYADPQALVKDVNDAVASIAKALQPRYPNLAQLLGKPVAGGPPLLVAAFSYFFRREVEKNHELAHGLTLDGVKRLATTLDLKQA
jgi:hypothetical protein